MIKETVLFILAIILSSVGVGIMTCNVGSGLLSAGFGFFLAFIFLE